MYEKDLLRSVGKSVELRLYVDGNNNKENKERKSNMLCWTTF